MALLNDCFIFTKLYHWTVFYIYSLEEGYNNSKFHISFSTFVTLANNDQNQAGKTKLDRERVKLCMQELVKHSDFN